MQQFWSAIFGDDHPVEVEIGSGTGTFLLPAAAAHPQRNYFGLERSYSRATRLRAALAVRALANVRLLCADAACVITTIIPAESVAAYHVYFPDPWWKRRHHRRRLFTPGFVAALARTLAPAGRLYTATDVPDTFALICATLQASRAFQRDPAARSPRPTLTAFERKGLTRGATIQEAVFVRLPEVAAYTSSAAPITPAASPS